MIDAIKINISQMFYLFRALAIHIPTKELNHLQFPITCFIRKGTPLPE